MCRREKPGVKMTSPQKRKSGGRRNPAGSVGFGRPPKAHQFKPGESGNPKGRPKGSKNESTILQELLMRKISIQQNGRARNVTVLEAILLRITEDSLKGNTKSAAFLLNRHAGVLAADEVPQADLNEDDKAILQAFAQRLTQQGKSS
jgi:hypothetical protein